MPPAARAPSSEPSAPLLIPRQPAATVSFISVTALLLSGLIVALIAGLAALPMARRKNRNRAWAQLSFYLTPAFLILWMLPPRRAAAGQGADRPVPPWATGSGAMASGLSYDDQPIDEPSARLIEILGIGSVTAQLLLFAGRFW